MKPELNMEEDERQLIMGQLEEKGWVRHHDHWRHPKTHMCFSFHTAAQIAGVWPPGDKNDSLHPFVEQIKRRIDDRVEE